MSEPPAIVAMPRQHLQEIADYLQTRPWNEVAGLMNHLLAAQPGCYLDEKAEEAETTT